MFGLGGFRRKRRRRGRKTPAKATTPAQQRAHEARRQQRVLTGMRIGTTAGLFYVLTRPSKGTVTWVETPPPTIGSPGSGYGPPGRYKRGGLSIVKGGNGKKR